MLRNLAQSFALGAQVAEELDGTDLKGIFVLNDGLHVNGSDLVEGLQSALPDTSITGGLTGDWAAFTQTFLLHGTKIHHKIVTAVGIYGKYALMTSGALVGWKPYGPNPFSP